MVWRLALSAAFLATLAFAGPASADDLYGTLKKVNDSGKIVIGHNADSPPFSYIGANGKPEGYTIDLCHRVAEDVKKELKRPDLKIEYVSLTPVNRIPLLVNGTVDMVCATTTNNFTRQRQVDYLSTMYISGARIITRADTGIKSLADLKGRPVTVNQGSSNEQIMKALDEQQKLGIRFINTKDNPQAWASLESSRSDAHVTDEPTAYGLVVASKQPDKYLVVPGPRLSFDPFAIVVRRDDSAFRLVGNKALADLYRSGEIDKIYEKWLSTIGMSMDPETKTLFKVQALPE